MTITSKPALSVEPGDIIVFLGTPHLIESTDTRNAFGDPVARAADGWGIALCENVDLYVAVKS